MTVPVLGPRRGSRRLAALVVASSMGAVVLAGCSSAEDPGARADGTVGSETPSPSEPVKTVSDAQVSVNVPRGGHVTVDTVVKVSAEDGTLRGVRVEAGDARLPGSLSEDDTRWTASERLEPGTRYVVHGVAVDDDGLVRRVERPFRSEPLTLDQQTYASIAPIQGETVGVGMPVIVSFDIPVTDRAEIERHLSVEATPAQPGAWHWISDTEVHYRPKVYWRAGTRVSVHADVNGVHAGNGIYGQDDRDIDFRVGRRVIMSVDAAAHRMQVREDGRLLRTIPITAGKSGFTTRSGIKVIVEKFRTKRMDAATTGISRDDPEYYNLSNVEYAQRVTYSGEFIHAAPWSVGFQGADNVSHGCVGMSTDQAAWLYGLTRRGDVVDVTGTDRPMEPTNGFGDWNVSWSDYRAGSALS